MARTILVVDDDGAIRDSISGVLADEGFQVAAASSGAEALAMVEANPPDLVLLDVWMPELDGIQVLEELQRRRVDLPVIVISGHGNVETAVRATKLGAVDFIEKPFSLDGLLHAIRKVLGGGGGSGGDDVVSAGSSNGAKASGLGVPERTLAASVVGGGLGLHSGVRTGLILQPAPAGTGIRFGSVAGAGEVAARVSNVDSTGYATTLHRDGVGARTVEHLMATLHAYGITNLIVKVEGEVPILDGSAVQFCELVESTGVVDQGSTIPAITVDETVRVEAGGDGWIEVRPYDGFRITYELSYPEPVGDQTYVFEFTGPEAFRDEIAPARTFGFVEEIRALEGAGLGQGGQLSNFILIGEKGIVNTELRFPEELARHKILDIMGDLFLVGTSIRGEVHARKTGHSTNIELVRRLEDFRV